MTLIIATRNRAPMLASLLAALADQSAIVNCQVVVADNGSNDNTRELVDTYSSVLPHLSYIYESIQGKSLALNRALDQSEIGLTVFCDDDILPSVDWLSEYCKGVARYPDAAGFCGPIVPRLRSSDCPLVHDSTFPGFLTGHFAPDADEGALPNSVHPFGANFAVNRHHIDTRFRVDLGPGRQGAFLCEDTEFMNRICRKTGRSIIYLPRASVVHLVAEDQITPAKECERAFFLGRSVVRRGFDLLVCPANFETKSHAGVERRLAFSRVANIYLGQLAEFHIIEDKRLVEFFALRLAALSEKNLICAGQGRNWIAQEETRLPKYLRILLSSVFQFDR